jgi:Tol biopolymer transport system component
MGLRGTRRLVAALVAFSLALLVLVCALVLSAQPAAAKGGGKGKCAKKHRAHRGKACKKRHKRHPRRPGATPSPPGSPYSGRFVSQVHSFTFSQAPGWSPDGRRVTDQRVVDGTQQVFTANLDGSDPKCVTCGQPGPNMVASYRPQGDKILFHSWRDDPYFRVGSPGFGGVGSDVFVTNTDGSGNAVNLTRTLETTVTGGPSTGDGEDNYHAYFSPGGNKIAWTHLDCNFITQDGRCKMEILYADYVDPPDDPANPNDPATAPHLENVRQARPENGAYYETQLWAPDGSGFLYTESVDHSLNLELFFYNVNTGRISRLTDNAAWDEQATFTPDMSKVIFMSTRDHPGLFNSYRQLADALGIPADTDWATILPVFELGFLQPIAQESTDLYELDLSTGNVRRLTDHGDNGWITPEFSWDPNSARLLWTESRFPDGTRMQEPIDPARDIREFLAYVSSGNLPIDPREGGGNVGLDTVAGLQRRTLLGHYEP